MLSIFAAKFPCPIQLNKKTMYRFKLQKPCHSLALILSLFLPPIGAYANSENSACEREMQELANTFRSEFDDLIADKNADMTSLESRYLKLPGANKQDFDVFVKRTSNRLNIEDKVLTEYDIYFNTLLAIPNDDAMKHNCEDPDLVEEKTENKLEWIEGKFQSLLNATEERVELEDLDDDEGLVLVAAYANSYGELKIKGRDDLKFNVSSYPYIKLHKLTAGQYQYFKLQRKQWDNSVHYYNFEDDNLTFDVEAGKVNFSGVFMFKEFNQTGWGELFDRASMLLTILESDYPIIARKYDWNNGVTDFDTFINFYRQEMASKQEQQ